MSTIRLLGTAATSATPYPGTQAGLDAALAAAAAAGGAIEVSTGLESLTGAITSGTIVARFRFTPTPGLELMSGDFILANGQSVRFVDTLGTIRTVLTALGTGVTRLAYLSSGGLTITDQNGTIKATVTGTRFNLGSGVDLAFNGSAGTVGQVATSQGPGVSPTYTLPAGLPGSVMTVGLPAKLWSNGLLVSGTDYLYNTTSGAANTHNLLLFRVPSSYTATTSWKVHWSPVNTEVLQHTWRLGMRTWTAGGLVTGAYTFGTDGSDNAPGTTEQLVITTVGTPAVALVAGQWVMLDLLRLGTDSSINASNFHSLEFNYT